MSDTAADVRDRHGEGLSLPSVTLTVGLNRPIIGHPIPWLDLTSEEEAELVRQIEAYGGDDHPALLVLFPQELVDAVEHPLDGMGADQFLELWLEEFHRRNALQAEVETLKQAHELLQDDAGRARLLALIRLGLRGGVRW